MLRPSSDQKPKPSDPDQTRVGGLAKLKAVCLGGGGGGMEGGSALCREPYAGHCL